MRGVGSQVVELTRASVWVLSALAWLVACDSPARVKPWRHAPDPTAEAARAPGSPTLADVAADGEIRNDRSHTLRIHVDADPGRLNPLVAPTVWGRRITLGTVFEPLLRYIPPEGNQVAGRFGPRLARSWRHVTYPGITGLEIRIELEPDVKFHDGRPLTTSDVQFTLDAIRDPRRGVDHLRAMLEDVEATELLTPTVMNIRLHRPSGWVLRALAEIPIMPMHVYEGSLVGGGALVGTGPWKVAANKHGTVHLARFDGYWGAKAAIQNIEFVYQPDAATALKDAKRGDFDIIPALVPAHWPEQANAPGIARAFRPLQLRPPRMRYLTFNAKRVPMDDAKVRHALALLVHRSDFETRVFDGLARPALWPIWPGGFVNGPETPVPAFDPKEASKLLDAAGWTDSDKDGIRDKNGVQLKLVMIGGEKPPQKDLTGPPVKNERELFVEACRRIGVVIEMKTGGESWVAKKLGEGAYDLAEVVWNGMVDMDVSRRLGSKHGQIASSPRIDRIFDEMAASIDPADRARLAGELVQAFEETWPIAGIVADAPQGLVALRVQGLRVWDGWFDLTQLRFDPKTP